MDTTLAPSLDTAIPFVVPTSRWDDSVAAGLSPAELLLYRSNLLGSDLTVTNFGGGNTSAKLAGVDPLTGEGTEVLWVKGSGGDIGSMKLDGFATLYQDKLLGLEKHSGGPEDDDKMVGYLPHCTFNLNSRAASIDTPLHSLLPFAHVDHVHPDAIIALAASSGGEAATQEIWGGKIGWLPWKRPGYSLGVMLRDYVEANPHVEGVMLAGHGIICWADSAKACYEHTIGLIADAANYLNSRLAGKPAFGGALSFSNSSGERAAAAADLMPRLRGLMTGARRKVGHFSDDAEALEFVNSADFERLAALGTSCPDHFLRTKIAPLTLDPAKLQDDAYLAQKIADYRDLYAAYYERCKRGNSPAMRDSNPVVVLVPGVGRITFATDKTTARLAGEFYGNAINVMRGAEAIGEYIALDEQEAFDIEYWLLEEAKLQRMPAPKPLAGRVALVTGGAGGIGAATAARLMADGACVMLADRDGKAVEEVRAGFARQFGHDVVRAAVCDVTDEGQVEAAFESCAREFGGLDILVANAGIASSAPIEETTIELWSRNYDVLAQGYFLTSKHAWKLLKGMKEQGGTSVVFIGSKNGVAAATNASAYASAKAAANHLARCLALEGAPFGIRVNTVNPDAVIKGSRIWDGDWRKERAGAHGIDSGKELEEHYRQRSMLKRDVLPSDIAEAVYFLAGDQSAKSTGNMINVDAGNAQAFTR
ncbi:bifunctional rhamnulose-1-phosphate aldolase/short-chain dehydrogenase [Novosphingobium album (ex Hu et al. 2023)]|uniref:Bifunctional rhamnulose-1-phosphate aldolase/short-chain dehydrogenase n=1 Tax=Novosphingobium album (ex Hu et al. 2023) TaxID=2930093 RepID=A0ABT0B5D4_9SPHN|nr:bifunctional rhamnulose-1-phosphate aldolase/short-chain dehydrogenase [Novosphingobium album (ex Hu et al. 2023)]MCJ2180276.1 bifunctional rhamnulose-1-phosphate aldolase/short-chain dehydrogenase [Novosphingobium album (ex Hu et al. 2023)]